MEKDIDTSYLWVDCTGCPTLVRGIAPDGRRVRFRYRFGVAIVSINDERVWSAQLGDDYDGVLYEGIAKRITAAVVDNDEAALAEAVRDARRDQGVSV